MWCFLNRYKAALLSGVLLACSFPSFHWHPLAWVALLPLFILAQHLSPRNAALHFFLSGWVFYSLLLQWLISNIFWAGGWALLGYQLLCIGLALFWGLLGAAWVSIRKYLPYQALSPLLLMTLWGGMEWIQANLFTGFGWGALGYSQGGNPFVLQWAAWGGVLLLSCVLILCNALLATAWITKKHRLIYLGAACLLLGGLHLGGKLLMEEANYGEEPFQVGLYQSNYAQEMKWDPEFTVPMVRMAVEQAQIVQTQKKQQQADLWVWPEALVMCDFSREAVLPCLKEMTSSTNSFLFAGTTRVESGPVRREYNSSVLLEPSGTVCDVYDKVHLAPFGEYMPFDTLFPFLRQIVPTDVDAGEKQKVLKLPLRQLGPLICFEVLFSPMAVALQRQGADFLTVITNLAWFGSSNAVAQELEIARMRAVETRLPLVHCANTGISGVFDPYGRFAPLCSTLVYPGRLIQWDYACEHPMANLMQRRIGILPVPLPATGGTILGVRYFPLLLLGLFLCFLGISLYCWQCGRHTNRDGGEAADA